MTVFDAIENGDLRSLRKLMRAGIDLEEVDDQSGAAPLALAAECGRLDVVEILLRAGVDPDWGGATTPLEAAALEGHVDVAAALIRARADVNRPVADGFTPLITAAATGHLELVRLLLEAGANPLVRDDEGQSALTAAKKNAHQEVVEELRDRLGGGNGYRRGAAGDLFAALECRDAERLEEILDGDGRQQHLAATDRAGFTPLARSAQLGHLALVRALLDAGADVEAGGPATPLYCAAEQRHDPVVAALLASGADVNAACGERRRTPVMAAAAAGSIETVRRLLEGGADPKILDAEKKDALWHAARAGHEQTFGFLVPHVKVADRKSATAELASRVERRRKLATSAALMTDLMHAGKYAEAKQLLAGGLIDPDGFDEQGRTALMLAARAGRRDIVRMLIAAGASFELRDDLEGYTALIHSIHSDAPQAHLTVSILAAAGADLDRPSADGRTPIMHAIDHYLGREDGDVTALTARADPLVHLGGNLEARDADGRTAWARVRRRALDEETTAAGRRQLSRVRRALERYGARVTGGEPLDLMTAASEGHSGRVRELLAGFSGDQLAGLPALTVAAAHDHWDVVSLLVDAGIDIDTRNGKGETILMQAAAQGTLPIVEQLVRAGADPELKNAAGETAAEIAAAAGHEDLATLLGR